MPLALSRSRAVSRLILRRRILPHVATTTGNELAIALPQHVGHSSSRCSISLLGEVFFQYRCGVIERCMSGNDSYCRVPHDRIEVMTS